MTDSVSVWCVECLYLSNLMEDLDQGRIHLTKYVSETGYVIEVGVRWVLKRLISPVTSKSYQKLSRLSTKLVTDGISAQRSSSAENVSIS